MTMENTAMEEMAQTAPKSTGARVKMLSAVLFTSYAVAACVTSPTTPTTLSSQFATTTFTGYAITPSAPVEVLVFNFRTNGWDVAATTTASATPTVPANTVGDNPDLYSWSVPAAIATLGDPNSYYHWNAAGKETPAVCDVAQARVTAGGFNAYTFGPGGANCVADDIRAGDNLVVAVQDCSSPGGLIMVHWTDLPCIF